MSREFGQYSQGYFHTQMEYASEDCAESSNELTKLWGKWFEEFYHIAYAISSAEAGDSGIYFPIMESIKRLPQLRERLKDIEKYLQPFERVMEEAVRAKSST